MAIEHNIFFLQPVNGARRRYRFALWNPRRNSLHTWQAVYSISRPHFLSRSEE